MSDEVGDTRSRPEQQPVSPTRARRRLSRTELEDSLTDVRAEMFLLEAERLRANAPEHAGLEEQSGQSAEELVRKRALIDARLAELESKTAELLTELERLDLEPGDPRDGLRSGRNVS